MRKIGYSGKLDEAYGIRILLDAFSLIKDPELQLWVTGSGRLMEIVKEREEKDRRIRFLGLLENRDLVLQMEEEADVLVNPRLPSNPLSDFSFPSKLFEYLLSGTPVVSFRIGGIPEDYFPYLYLAERETPEALSSAILKALSLSREACLRRGRAAQRFIREEKSPREAAEKIWTFVRSL